LVGRQFEQHNLLIPFSGHDFRVSATKRRTGAGAMRLSLIETMFSIFRGHIPDNAVRTAAPVAIPAGAVMGVLAAAGLSIGLVAGTVWATVSLAIWLI
jgi:hypothetical protein